MVWVWVCGGGRQAVGAAEQASEVPTSNTHQLDLQVLLGLPQRGRCAYCFVDYLVCCVCC